MSSIQGLTCITNQLRPTSSRIVSSVGKNTAPPVRNLQRCTAPQNRFKIAVQLNYSCSAAF